MATWFQAPGRTGVHVQRRRNVPNRTVAGRYQVLREVGRGGMATVFLCEDLKHHREVALKALRPDLAAIIGAERFLREIEITAGLNHPHILPLLDSGADDGLLFFVMPYVAGGSLRLLLSGGPVPLDAAVRIAGDVASALDYAHARGVVHRDVKPENVMFNEGLAVVSDFGIARAVSAVPGSRLTVTGLSVGTLGYMSPEQALGTGELDGRTDVYSLGCVVFEMLTGATPASWPGAEDVALGRFAELPASHRARLDGYPGRVEQSLVHALALRAQHRYSTAGEFAASLAAASQRTLPFTDEQVRQLLQRAAELQAEAPEPAASGGLTIGAVEQIAAQVGIPPFHVREAARSLELRASAPVLRGSAPAAVPARPGQEPRWDRLVATAAAPNEVSEDTFPAMVQEIERQLGIAGHVTIIGGMLTWSPATQGEESRKVVVQVAARAGGTTIRIQENLELQGWRRVAIPVGVLTGGGFGLGWTQLFGVGEPAGPLLAGLCAVGGVFLALRMVVSSDAMDRGPKLQELANALAEMVSPSPESLVPVGAAPAPTSPAR